MSKDFSKLPTAPPQPTVLPSEANQQPAVRSLAIRWNTWLGVLFVLVVFYVSQLLAGLLASVYPWAQHWNSSRSATWLNNSVLAQFGFVLVAEATAVAAILQFLKLYRVRIEAIGLRRPRWSDVGYGLLAVPVYYVLYLLSVTVISHFVPSLNVNQAQDIGFTHVQGFWQLGLTFLSLVVFPPLAEEIMVRGFLYSSLKKAIPIGGAVVLTSAIFAAAHLPEGGAVGPLYIAALDTFVLSLVLIYLREKTGGLWSSITLHAIKNGVAFVALFILHVH